jgi:hypothetical protein
VFVLHNKNGWGDLKKGDLIRHRLHEPPSMREYFRLHDAKLEREVLKFVLNEFQVVGKTLYVLNQCSKFTEDLRCSGYPDNRPRVCKEYDVQTYGTGRFYDPPNCLFRFKQEK